jgi:hypothetical protein
MWGWVTKAEVDRLKRIVCARGCGCKVLIVGSESGRTDKNYRIRIDVDGIEQKRAIGCAQDDGESGSERKE